MKKYLVIWKEHHTAMTEASNQDDAIRQAYEIGRLNPDTTKYNTILDSIKEYPECLYCGLSDEVVTCSQCGNKRNHKKDSFNDIEHTCKDCGSSIVDESIL